MTEQPIELPVVQYDPQVLSKLVNAYTVYQAAQAESVREQEEAVETIAASHAEHIARCASVFHGLMAEAFAVGFTPSQVSAQLALFDPEYGTGN